MFKNPHWTRYLAYAVTAAIIYSLAVAFFLQDSTYSESWLLYLGNALFMVVIVLFLFSYNRRREKNARSMAMLKAGFVTSTMGVIISCLLCFILLSIMIPGLFHSGTPDKVLTGEPVNTVPDKTHGMLFMIFGSAIIGNLAVGMFVCIIFPFTLKGDQTKENVSSEQAEIP
jgi:uncharacterized membrane protein